MSHTTQEISIIVNDRPTKAYVGESLIAVLDRANLDVPRFCYHPKLSVVASCRMCLVSLNKQPRLVPSCATIVSEGMCVDTTTEDVRHAWQDNMQFLLANHPLDCPICEKGGECALQDTAVAYGSPVSHFHEAKRAVPDIDLGPFITTHMTRCIQCSRCVRFCEEIDNIPDIGWVDRSDHMRIDTTLKRHQHSSVLGNIIDLCPVGALTSRLSDGQGRSWSYRAYRAVSVHDGYATPLWWHVRRATQDEKPCIMRVVPRTDSEAIWLADKDRFSYPAFTYKRLKTPMKRNAQGVLEACSWQDALLRIRNIISQLSPQEKASSVLWTGVHTTMEEGYYVQQWWRSAVSSHIFSDTRVVDDRDRAQWQSPVGSSYPWHTLEDYAHIVVIGGDIRQDIPVLGLDLVACSQKGCIVHSIGHKNDAIDSAHHQEVLASEWLAWLRDIGSGHFLSGLKGRVMIILAIDVWHHIEASALRHAVAIWCESRMVAGEISHWIQLTPGPNVAGLHAVGCVGHRDHQGILPLEKQGCVVDAILSPKLMFLHGIDDMREMVAPPITSETICIAAHYYTHPFLMEHAEVLLPIAHIPEITGHYMSMTGELQTWDNIGATYGYARSAQDVYQELCMSWGVDTVPFKAWLDVWMQQQKEHRVGVYNIAQSYASRDFVPIQRIHPSQADPTLRRSFAHHYVYEPHQYPDIIYRDTLYAEDAL